MECVTLCRTCSKEVAKERKDSTTEPCTVWSFSIRYAYTQEEIINRLWGTHRLLVFVRRLCYDLCARRLRLRYEQ